jgi:chromosome segregation ATPase
MNLQRSVERLTKEMAAIGNKVAKEESRGDIIAMKIDSLEDTQKVLSESLIDLVKGIKEVKDDARNEASGLKDMMRQMKDSKDDDRKQASELKYMMRQLMNSNNSNNNRSNPRSQRAVHGQQQVVYGGTGTT